MVSRIQRFYKNVFIYFSYFLVVIEIDPIKKFKYNSCLVKDFEKRPSATNLLEHPFLEKAARNQKELESDLKELVEWERQNMDNLNKKPDVTTKHGQFKSKRKSKRYLPQTANDLATLESFDEDSIVAQLFNRFMQGQIYTYIGDILLAVNPFTNINIYSNKVCFIILCFEF